eukprot:CAMPEP_0117659696 /NCGR_PEP_ID=MMETSP0804-20121206/6569_1 /TAXON_ID=1074897 /ORGANISM="Tetraselmis astigmatica, Strain CCMP880" /LENGTH=385 /DNA_ID=CAMNT_0005466369 /DNA_START=151 /DNA_END=1304 /DNA_ORIENTATION=+
MGHWEGVLAPRVGRAILLMLLAIGNCAPAAARTLTHIQQTGTFKGKAEQLDDDGLAAMKGALAQELEAWHAEFSYEEINVYLWSLYLEVTVTASGGSMGSASKSALESQGYLAETLKSQRALPLTAQSQESWRINRKENSATVNLIISLQPFQYSFIEEDVQLIQEVIQTTAVLEQLKAYGLELKKLTLDKPVEKYAILRFSVETFDEPSAKAATQLMSVDFIYSDVFRRAELEPMELLTLNMNVELWTPPAPPPSPPAAPSPPPAPLNPAPPYLPGTSSAALGLTTWQSVWPTTAFPVELTDPDNLFGEGLTLELFLQSTPLEQHGKERPPQTLLAAHRADSGADLLTLSLTSDMAVAFCISGHCVTTEPNAIVNYRSYHVAVA